MATSYKKRLDNYIKVEDAVRVLCDKTCYRGVACPDNYCKEVREPFDDIPAADVVERKRGQWLPENRTMDAFWVCSACGFPSEAHAANVLYNFCPNCGADMREADKQ